MRTPGGKTIGLLAMGCAALLLCFALTLFLHPLPPVGSVRFVAEKDGPLDRTHEKTDWVEWREPEAQSAGPQWIFEIFTPPLIYYNAREETFSLEPPLAEERVQEAFALMLKDVRRELFRLQYTGHSGGEGNYLVEIRDLEAGAWLTGRPGDEFAESGFIVRSFSVRKERLHQDGGSVLFFEVPHLLLEDLRSGATHLLTNEPHYEEEPVAVFRDQEGELYSLRTGQDIRIGESRYILEKLSLEPAEARVRQESATGKFTRTRTLHPPLQGSGSDPPATVDLFP